MPPELRSKYSEVAQIVEELKNPERRIGGDFAGKDVISVEQFDQLSIAMVLERAEEIERLERRERKQILENKHVSIVFYQPSTRTFTSFYRAAQELGAQVHGMQGMEFSSVNKGESLEDTMRAIESYGTDLVVLRHGDDNSSLIAADELGIPVINGGAGKLEHPTQALLDLRTIVKESPLVDPRRMRIGFVGDLKYGRTVHSLSRLLSITGVRTLSFVAPESLQMPMGLCQQLSADGVPFELTENLEEVIGKVDVLYVTRIQEEWFEPEEYAKVAGFYQVNNQMMRKMKPEAILMHPLPRKSEIALEVDSDPRAVYKTKQMEHGFYVRMALLDLILNE